MALTVSARSTMYCGVLCEKKIKKIVLGAHFFETLPSMYMRLVSLAPKQSLNKYSIDSGVIGA